MYKLIRYGTDNIGPVLDLIAGADICKRPWGNHAGKKKVDYRNIVTAFDIETTWLRDIDQSIMYVWQWAFTADYVVVGRYWSEFLDLCQLIGGLLNDDELLCCEVHNLSYEFQFLAGIYSFAPDDVFALSSRKVLKAVMRDYKIEFRCSYIQSNMSLDAFTRAMGVEHAKLHDYDYLQIRYPWTELTDDELAYCVHDVIGLVEAMQVRMEKEGDNLYTIPLTSTGYVRRDIKKRMRPARRYVNQMIPAYNVFNDLRLAFRGGDTHANRHVVGDILENVHSWDRSSSYPDVICNCKFPMSEFQYLGCITLDRYYEYVDSGKAMLIYCVFYNITINDDLISVPYIPFSKCPQISGEVLDNGRVLKADYLEICLTDIDFAIICNEYSWNNGSCQIVRAWCARYGYLPQEFRDANIAYYKAKTELKGLPDQKYYYDRAKALLNSIYGLTAYNPMKDDVQYQEGAENGGFAIRPKTAEDYEALHQWLPYQWGCWVTSWARFRLREGIWLVEQSENGIMVYCDTDSVKYIGDVDWTQYNQRRTQASKENGAYAVDPSGKTHYMGVYEQEEDYDRFRTWGAKKYAYEIGGHVGVTVSGVNKKEGGRELEKYGGLDAFDIGFTFHDAGGLELLYNDGHYGEYRKDGHVLDITRNVVIKPSTYKLSITKEFEDIIKYFSLQGDELKLL